MKKKGILLINLGTPDRPDIKSIRRYLKEFLMDERVLDLPKLLRYGLVYGFIAPFRPYKTKKAYEAIWQKSGSPLRVHTESLQKALQQSLPHNYQVAIGMRYGNPSIQEGLRSLQSCEELVILPLFPQYASASTGSAIAKSLTLIQQYWNIPTLTIIDQFYQHPGFIQSYKKLIEPYLEDPESFLLLSYHGLPERHLTKSQCKAQCDRQGACPKVDHSNHFCYRAQCYSTSQYITHALGLEEKRYMTCFQSRLGRTPWVQPYTDQQLYTLRERGVEKLVVCCPSFVSDCLETLEEIGIGLKKQWQTMGGQTFTLIPCINEQHEWIQALAHWLQSLSTKGLRGY